MDELDYNDDDLSRIEKIIRDSYHPTNDELGNYILYQNGIDPLEDKSIIKLAPKIELHLRKCSACNKLFLELNREYAELDSFLTNESANVKITSEPAVAQRSQFNLKKYSITLITICLLYLASFTVSDLVTPKYYKYAALDNRSDLYETRGRVSSSFQESLKALENKDYESAVKWLNGDINSNQLNETIFYSHYILGLTYLELSKSEFLGLFPSYNPANVTKGISSLNKALELNNSGKYRNINLDIYFYLGKADLMLNNKTGAKEYLFKVVNEKGSHLSEAKNILEGLN
jgi:hypothetical protein